MPPSERVVCLGEALVDFVCERPVERLAHADAFVPRFGGSPANIAVSAGRFGARTALLGGAGADAWGRWLRDVLAEQEVDVRRFSLLDGVPTPHTFVAVTDSGEPTYAFYGEGSEACIASAGPHLSAALAAPREGAGVFVLGSDTLIGPSQRAVTMRARELALERNWLVLYDPNLRPVRWTDEVGMREAALRCLPGATLVKANLEEARILTRCTEPPQCIAALLRAGARGVVMTMGADGLLIGTEESEPVHVPAAPASAVDTTGAGDSVAGVLAAALARTGGLAGLERVAALAARTAAGVVGAWGAIGGLPAAADARAALDAALAGGEAA